MSLYRSAQANPDEYPQDRETVLIPVEGTVKALEQNKGAVHRWFWKGLLAFNLVLWSVALPLAFLLTF